ncbi:MAG: hypothetical protein Q6363_000470 [Candidatus Njordarchaeota archaeon]
MGFLSDFVRALFIGFVFTPVFFVVFNAIAFEAGIFILFRGAPLTVHSIAMWLLLATEESRRTINMVAVSISWISGWLLVWSRSKKLRSVLIAMPISFLLYIVYLVSFWNIGLMLVFPESFVQILSAIGACILFEIIRKKRPRKTIFERLESIGIVFPEYWKMKIDLPIKCPRCGERLYSSARYCWNCKFDLEKYYAEMVNTK